MKNWFGSKKEDNNVVATMDGKAIVTIGELEKQKQIIIAQNPQLQDVLARMGQEKFNQQVAEELIGRAIIDRFVTDQGLDQKESYKRKLQESIDELERMLKANHFMDTLTLMPITDEHVRNFYEALKKEDISKIPPFMIASRKEDKIEYASFDAVAKQLRAVLEREARYNAYAHKIAELKEKYNVKLAS